MSCEKKNVRVVKDSLGNFRYFDLTAPGFPEITDPVRIAEIQAEISTEEDCECCSCIPFDTCFLPDQYAIQWGWNGSGQLQSYNPLDGTWTSYGDTGPGGYALAFKNDTTDPTLFFQAAGNLYKADPSDPIGTFSLVGPTLPAAPSSYPCFAFDPSGRLLAGIGSNSSVIEIDPVTGAATNIGSLIDVRDGATLSASPGDWFFDPSGRWFLMARDNRGATFGVCTGTVLWEINPSTLETTRISNSCSPVSGTGAEWLAANRYLLSTSSGIVYEYNAYQDTWTVFSTAPQGINDLSAQWVIPDPIRVTGYINPDCTTDPIECGEHFLFTLNSDPQTGEVNCDRFETQISGKFGVCEKEPNPFVNDPFSPAGGNSGCDRCPDEDWHEGCSDAGLTKWRRSYDPSGNLSVQYLYGTLTDPVTAMPPGFSYLPCGTVQPGTENITTWCDLDSGNTVYRKEETLTNGTIVVTWFNESGNIPEPLNRVPDACDTNDPLLPVTEEVVCVDGESYVRVVKETNAINADGLPELINYQIVYFNADGTLYDSGIIPAGSLPVGEPEDWYLGNCVDPYVEIKEEKLCEKDAEFLLLIDSNGVFARYSFFTKAWSEVTTLSVASAGGSTDVENFRLYNFVSPDQLTTVDVNTDTQLPNTTLTSGILKPGQLANPLTFSAASFRTANGRLYAWDTAGADAGLYSVDVNTGVVDFVTTISGVAGTGTSIMIDNTTDTLIINGSNLSYDVDWVTGVATLWGNPPIQPNGGTFDDAGNAYVTSANDTYCLEAGQNANDPSAWVQIIDDFTAGANSIAYYKVEAQKPECFKRRFGILADGSKEIIGDFNVDDDSPRTVVGDVDCCECGCGDTNGSTTIPQDTCQLFKYYEAESEATEGTLRRREWLNTGAAQNDPVTLQGSLDILATFNVEGGLPIPNSAPDTDAIISSNLDVNDSNNAAIVVDYEIKEFFAVVEKPTYFRFLGTSERYNAVYLGKCGGSYEKIFEFSTNAGGPGYQGDTFGILPAGIHRVAILNLDSNGSNASGTFQVSQDGITWSSTEQDAISWYSETVSDVCKHGYACDENYFELDKTTPIANPRLCKIECSDSCCEGEEGGGSTIDEQALAEAIVSEQRNVTPVLESFLNTNAVESLSVPPGTRGRIVSVEDTGTGLVRWTIDGTNPTTTNGFTTTGPYHAAYNLNNVDLSLVRLDGSSGASDYSVMYEIYN